MPDPAATMVDVSYPLLGAAVPRDHGRVLAEALERLVPWLADAREAGVHRVNAVAGVGNQALLSRRARLTLRVRRERVRDLLPLQGTRLEVGGLSLRVGDVGVVRELLAHSALYAHVVTTADADELAFLGTIGRELDLLGVPCRQICGRRQMIDHDGGLLTGFSLMLDGLSADGALRVLESGLGRHRRLGCGMFIPHKSGAALRV